MGRSVWINLNISNAILYAEFLPSRHWAKVGALPTEGVGWGGEPRVDTRGLSESRGCVGWLFTLSTEHRNALCIPGTVPKAKAITLGRGAGR